MPDPVAPAPRPSAELVRSLLVLARSSNAKLDGTDVPLIRQDGGGSDPDPVFGITLSTFQDLVDEWLANQGPCATVHLDAKLIEEQLAAAKEAMQAALDRAVLAESRLEAVEAELAKKDDLVQELNVQVGLLEGDLKNARTELDGLQLTLEPLRRRNDELESAARRADAVLRSVLLPVSKVPGERA